MSLLCNKRQGCKMHRHLRREPLAAQSVTTLRTRESLVSGDSKERTGRRGMPFGAYIPPPRILSVPLLPTYWPFSFH